MRFVVQCEAQVNMPFLSSRRAVDTLIYEMVLSLQMRTRNSEWYRDNV